MSNRIWPADSMTLREAAVKLDDPRLAVLADRLDELSLNWVDVCAMNELYASSSKVAAQNSTTPLGAYALGLLARIGDFLAPGTPEHPGVRVYQFHKRTVRRFEQFPPTHGQDIYREALGM